MIPASPARCCRNPVQCIVPPYMVEQMAHCPDHRIRERALAALAHGAAMRDNRTKAKWVPLS